MSLLTQPHNSTEAAKCIHSSRSSTPLIADSTREMAPGEWEWAIQTEGGPAPDSNWFDQLTDVPPEVIAGLKETFARKLTVAR